MSPRVVWLAAVLLALVAGAPRPVEARASFVVLGADSGLRDPTPVLPIGGNSGRTLGEQRRKVIEKALSIWGEALDSAVPIVVRVWYQEQECGPTSGSIAGAAATHLLSAPGGDPALLYPAALADRIAGYDLTSGEPDLDIVFNTSLDHPPCSRNLPLYYGLDHAAGGRIDLVATTLHELAHGLGFASFVDARTGELEMPMGIDVFSAHVRDIDRDATWAQLTESERARSAMNVRRLVFDGPETVRAAKARLDRGTPTLTLLPPLPGFSGAVAPVQLAPSPVDAPASGPVVLAQSLDGCGPLGDVAGKVVLVKADQSCYASVIVTNAERAGAIALLMTVAADYALPATPLGGKPFGATIPVLMLGTADAALIERALTGGALMAALGADDRQLGADRGGRPLLFASSPLVRGSSVSHFDMLAHPDLLMEPYTTDGQTHDLDLTVSVLHDLGWTKFCGDGKIEQDEECDEGPGNRDEPGSTCRTTCRRPRCGDGSLDPGEQCDRGQDNSDTAPGACRTSCVPARCGDGVRDPSEECDGSPDCTSSCSLQRIVAWETPTTPVARSDASGCQLGAPGRHDAGALALLLGLSLLLRRRARRARG